MAKPEQVGDPRDPANQADPKWYAQVAANQAKIAEEMLATLKKMQEGMPVNSPQAPTLSPAVLDRKALTTKEEAQEYDRFIGKTFVKCDPQTRKVLNAQEFYTPRHWFPQFVSSNQAEFIAKFAVEKWEWSKDANGEEVQKVLNCEHVAARTFALNYRHTMVDITSPEGAVLAQPAQVQPQSQPLGGAQALKPIGA